MRFDSETAEQIAARIIWKSGIYEFLIVDAQEKLSASRGNPMIELKIEIRRSDGMKKFVWDHLLPQQPEKLLHAAKTCDVMKRYQAGSLSDDDFVGKRGNLKLGIRKSRLFPPKNVVLDYL